MLPFITFLRFVLQMRKINPHIIYMAPPKKPLCLPVRQMPSRLTPSPLNPKINNVGKPANLNDTYNYNPVDIWV